MKLSTAQKATLAAALEHLLDNGPLDESMGICWNWDQLVIQSSRYSDTYSVLATLSVNWPGRTGKLNDKGDESIYPIAQEYDKQENRIPLWEGTQLAQRHALIDYLLTQLRA